MPSYTSDEKDFLKMIATKAVEPNQFFQLLVSENFFKRDFRPFMLIDSQNDCVLLFFSKGEKHKEFPRFVNFVALMEDLLADRLIVRVPMDQGTYFIGEFHDAQETKNDSGNTCYTSQSTGRYIEFPDVHILRDSSGATIAHLEIVKLDTKDHFERFSSAFSGMVYPREALKDLVKNKFRPVDQRRHRHAMIAAWTAIIVSLVFSSISICLSFDNRCFEAERDLLYFQLFVEE